MEFNIIALTSASDWDNIVTSYVDCSVYHLSEYQKAADAGKERLLFCFSQNGLTAALPVTIEKDSIGSIYGYPGWLLQHKEYPRDFFLSVEQLLKEYLQTHHFKGISSRLNPFTDYTTIRQSGMGVIREINKTVWINVDEYPKDSSTLLQRNIRYARRFEYVIQSGNTDLATTFHSLYTQCMVSKQADTRYLFPLAYFESLCRAESFECNIQIIYIDQEAIGGICLLKHKNHIEYHLGASTQKLKGSSVLKILLDNATKKAKAEGFHSLHLGGGLAGSSNDSLMFFKSQFSKQRKTFCVWELLSV